MKRRVLTIVILSAALLLSGMIASAGKAGPPSKESAVVEFPEKVKFYNAVLKGQYLFVHDEEKMMAGEDCTYVYNYQHGRQGELIFSFHCIPVQRAKALSFTVVTRRLLPDLQELVEYQFAGSTEGHRVP
jgi:hypothetical protein